MADFILSRTNHGTARDTDGIDVHGADHGPLTADRGIVHHRTTVFDDTDIRRCTADFKKHRLIHAGTSEHRRLKRPDPKAWLGQGVCAFLQCPLTPPSPRMIISGASMPASTALSVESAVPIIFGKMEPLTTAVLGSAFQAVQFRNIRKRTDDDAFSALPPELIFFTIIIYAEGFTGCQNRATLCQQVINDSMDIPFCKILL